jgi:hypothetical protein
MSIGLAGQMDLILCLWIGIVKPANKMFCSIRKRISDIVSDSENDINSMGGFSIHDEGEYQSV